MAISLKALLAIVPITLLALASCESRQPSQPLSQATSSPFPITASNPNPAISPNPAPSISGEYWIRDAATSGRVAGGSLTFEDLDSCRGKKDFELEECRRQEKENVLTPPYPPSSPSPAPSPNEGDMGNVVTIGYGAGRLAEWFSGLIKKPAVTGSSAIVIVVLILKYPKRQGH